MNFDFTPILDQLTQYGPLGAAGLIGAYLLKRRAAASTPTTLAGIQLPSLTSPGLLALIGVYLLSSGNTGDKLRGLLDTVKKVIDAITPPKPPEVK